jgi:plasmid stabilization system protein ParE
MPRGACARPSLVPFRCIRFPYVGRPQAVEGVRKLVTRQYHYLVYYTVDEPNEDVVVLSIQHPAREREHQDA